MSVTKAVIAAAGFGTRFLPQTKAMPKEMLPLVDKPIIQYVVEGLVEAGIKDIIIVTGYSKRSIEDHFDAPNAELTAVLQAGGKDAMLENLRGIADLANFAYVRQREVTGNAAPLLYAGNLIGDEPFVYVWADEFVEANPNHTAQMIAAYEQSQASVLPCIKVTEDKDYDKYGIVGGDQRDDGMLQLNSIVEKPGKDNAPSDLASIGGYLLTPDILPYIEKIAAEHDGTDELKIQTAMQLMIDDGKPFVAYEVQNAQYHDAGDKLKYLKTVVEFALRRKDIGEDFHEFLRTKV